MEESIEDVVLVIKDYPFNPQPRHFIPWPEGFVLPKPTIIIGELVEVKD